MRRTLLRTSLVMTLLCSIAICFTGCGGPTNLEEFLQKNQGNMDQLKKVAEKNSSDALTASVNVKKNTLTFSFKLKQTYGTEQAELIRQKIQEGMEKQETVFEDAASKLEEESGLEEVKLHVEYQNGDGSELYSEDY